MSKNVLIGVAWPYVNGDLHIGHLTGYLLPADLCARYNRIIGNNVLMVSGSDCFGTPITVEADKRGLTPQDVVDEYHKKDVDLFLNKLNLTYDLYTKTQTENHIKITQDFFMRMMDEGFIIIDSEEQYYSPKDRKFLPDRYVIGTCPFCGFEDARSDQCDKCGKLIGHGELKNPISNLSKEPVQLKDSDHYYIDWPKLQSKLEEYVEGVKDSWKEWVAKETLGWLKEGLKPRAITRDINWGVPIPADRIPKDKLISNYENKRIYVWFDAVIGYYSASVEWAGNNNKDYDNYWYDKKSDNQLKHYYFMGKDNLVFHAMFWPGQLMVFDPKIHLPDVVSINMFLDLGGKAFSKSRGVSISIKDFVDEFGNDAARFYLTLIMPEIRDSSFKWGDFEEKVNGVLVANLGNFIHRVLSIGKDIKSEDLKMYKIWNETELKVKEAFENSDNYLNRCEFRKYLDEILKLSSYGNSIVDREKLWEIKKSDSEWFNETLFQLYYVILGLKYLMNPLMPHASDRLADMTSTKRAERWNLGNLSEVLQEEVLEMNLKDVVPLFNKIEGIASRDSY
ncbi:Methionyl-tRNA synthetase [sediment metagenome]|uniref:methionine--tRNA ligase n=1 Tax=sediment metagenome TaxID=749907 RepID=D9PHK6_9ZZZZ